MEPSVIASPRTSGYIERFLDFSRNDKRGEGGIRTLGRLLGYGANETHLTTVTQVREICRRMSRFRARRCINEYETILFRKKETPACTGADHARSAGTIHPNVCANHYHL